MTTGDSVTSAGLELVHVHRQRALLERLGLGDVQKGDVLSIGSYRDARGVLVPDYNSIRIEREAEQ